MINTCSFSILGAIYDLAPPTGQGDLSDFEMLHLQAVVVGPMDLLTTAGEELLEYCPLGLRIPLPTGPESDR